MLPLVGSVSMFMHLSSVLLPVPDGPIIEMTSPSFIVTSMSLSGMVSSSNTFLRCLISIIDFS